MFQSSFRFSCLYVYLFVFVCVFVCVLVCVLQSFSRMQTKNFFLPWILIYCKMYCTRVYNLSCIIPTSQHVRAVYRIKCLRTKKVTSNKQIFFRWCKSSGRKNISEIIAAASSRSICSTSLFLYTSIYFIYISKDWTEVNLKATCVCSRR